LRDILFIALNGHIHALLSIRRRAIQVNAVFYLKHGFVYFMLYKADITVTLSTGRGGGGARFQQAGLGRARGAAATDYTDGGLQASAAYTYRVRATDVGTLVSAYAATAKRLEAAQLIVEEQPRQPRSTATRP
jgi:hypothetical protein